MIRGIPAIVPHYQQLANWEVGFDHNHYHRTQKAPFTVLEDICILLRMEQWKEMPKSQIYSALAELILVDRTWRGIENRYNRFLKDFRPEDIQRFMNYVRRGGSPNLCFIKTNGSILVDEGKANQQPEMNIYAQQQRMDIEGQVFQRNHPGMNERQQEMMEIEGRDAHRHRIHQERQRQFRDFGVQYQELQELDRMLRLGQKKSLKNEFQERIFDRLFQDQQKMIKPITILVGGEYEKFTLEEFFIMLDNASSNLGTMLCYLTEKKNGRRYQNYQHQWTKDDDQKLIRSSKNSSEREREEPEYKNLVEIKWSWRVSQRKKYLKNERRWKEWTDDQDDKLMKYINDHNRDAYNQVAREKKRWRTQLRVDWLMNRESFNRLFGRL